MCLIIGSCRFPLIPLSNSLFLPYKFLISMSINNFIWIGLKDGMENAKEFGRLCLTNLHNNPHKGSCLSKLAMGETAFSEPQHEFLGGQSNTEQESSVYEDFSHMARAEQSANEESDGESPIVGRDKLMDRPKPYHEFLDEVKKQKLRAEVEAWKKAEHMKLMTK